ncbi:MAG: hypothetical protein O7G87_18890 [bacterium]|nr:hypothetical protein [bacterium]
MRWVNLTILLLAGVLGCRPGEQVSVLGAVEKPGDYVYRPHWQTIDYVAAAGGFLSEADTPIARLIRVPADIPGEIDYREIQKWPLNEAPEVLPGDQIVVPHLTYSVQMDTLREVRDLEIDWQGRTYHLSRGLIAPGWTERGVMTAVVLGHGKVTQKENGADRTLAGFRFLFLQMHPGRYDRILSAVGKPVQKREAMEDAVEVYRFLFDRSAAFKAGSALRLAPEGYLRVLAGVWARPRTKADPGSGIRKREYPDGRVWTTYPDGRQRMEYPDGRVEVEFPGQVKEIRYPDGLIERLDSAGNRRVVREDGREVWFFKSGNRTTIYPDGRKLYEWPNGTRQTVLEDGTERTVFASGARQVLYPDGRKEVIDSTGVREMHYPDGRTVARMPDGQEVTRYPDHREIARLPDGTVIEVFPDGRKVQRNPSGEVLEVMPTGQMRMIYGDGTEMIKQAEGRARVQYPDGTVVEVYPDGRQVRRKVDGTTMEYHSDGRWVVWGKGDRSLEVFPDGRRVHTRAGGDRFESFPDGRHRWVSADPYRYRGEIFETLVRVDNIPEAAAPGARITLTGTVSDSVRRIYFAAFRVPDGHVVWETAFPRKGRFQGRIRVGRPGPYQVQVMAEVGEADVRTVMDRRVTVGNPEPMDTVVVEIPPYPGSDLAAERLLALIDSVRMGMNRRRLQENMQLTWMAEDRLTELLASGFLSHLSPIGQRVGQQLRDRQVTIFSVGENLGSGPSIEEVHWQLMMSAGHRRAILSEQWNTMGVAVARAHGTVWVVELFGRM